MIKRLKTFGLLLMLFQVLSIQSVLADDFEPADEPENSSNDIILDADNTGGDITIQFGDTLAETLRWVDASNYFELSDALVVDGNMNINGTIFRIDFDNVGGGADIDILAEQGSDSDGTLRYSAANNRWEISNDGGAFNEILSSASNVDADTLDTIDSASFLRSDATDSYSSGTLTLAGGTTLQADGTLDANGVIGLGDGGDTVTIDSSSWDISSAGVASGLTGVTSTGSVDFSGSTTVTVGGTLDANGIVTLGDGGDNVTIDSSVWDISSAGVASGLTGITSTGTIDFSSAANITVPHTNSTSFTLDNDEAGNPDQDIDIIAEQGTESNGTIRYDDGNNQWEISNDGGIFEAINVTNVLNAYDSDGGVTLSTTQTVASIETDRISDSAYSNSSGTVTIQQDGLYKVTGWVSVIMTNNAGAARNNLIVVFQDDTGGPFADIPGARCQDYVREQNAGDPASSCSVSYIKSYNNTDILRLTHFTDTANNAPDTVANASGMVIELIRPE